jgi:hypothetical protein
MFAPAVACRVSGRGRLAIVQDVRTMSARSVRLVMAGGSLVRLGYAVGLLLVPEAMSARRLAPVTRENAYARMTTRAFGGVHVNVALLTLRAAAQDRDTRTALGLNLGCDLGDLIATVLTWRDGDLPRGAVVGSAVVQSAGMATWGSLLRSS